MKSVTGIIYQDPKELEAQLSRFKDSEDCRFIKQDRIKLEVEWLVPDSDINEGLSYCVTYYTFRVTHFKDTWNLAGMQFTGFIFCDGSYDFETLNYLNSRLMY
jgi:hypothetical protein